MGNTYFTADLHLGHKKVAEIRGYDTDVHDELIVNDIIGALAPRDTLWILGDIMGTGSDRDYALDVLGQVGRETGATLRLVSGNHDTSHSMHRRAHREAPKYYPVFDSVQDFARIRYNNSDVLLSHFPYQGSGDRGASERYAQYRLPNMGLPLIHGHTHQEAPTVAHRPNQVCVSWDAWGRVASLDEVMKMINPFGLPMRPTSSASETASEVAKDLLAMTTNEVSPLVKPVGRFDPFQKTRWVASYLGAPLRMTKAEAVQDFINWYHAQINLEA